MSQKDVLHRVRKIEAYAEIIKDEMVLLKRELKGRGTPAKPIDQHEEVIDHALKKRMKHRLRIK